MRIYDPGKGSYITSQYQNLQHAQLFCSTWMTSCVHFRKIEGFSSHQELFSFREIGTKHRLQFIRTTARQPSIYCSDTIGLRQINLAEKKERDENRCANYDKGTEH